MTDLRSDDRFSISRYRDELLQGNRIALSQAITLTESSLPADQQRAADLIEQLLPSTGNAIRIGITGVPGVGKSTFIETFGKYLTSLGKKVAVLTIDPTSQKTRGSILGDKTRMEELARDPLAFIRPTASGNALGGVANATREAILLCEAAGFEIILIETVGVGQSEVAVRSMVDFFLLLMLAGAGDELQGIKKGIMEMADAMAITKADGENTTKALQAKADFKNALHLFQAPESGVYPDVLVTSALNKSGIVQTWDLIAAFIGFVKKNGFFEHQRNQQKIGWFYEAIDLQIRNKITGQSREEILRMEKQILEGKISPGKAASHIVSLLP